MANTTYKPVSVGDWMLTALLMSIPVINIILLFVWAFGNNTAISKANWAKAMLIWMLISIALYAILILIFGLGALGLAAAAS